MVRQIVAAAALLVLPAAAARAERLPMQSDVDKCALRATELGGRAMQGKVRLQLLVRRDGKVYAAHAHSSKGVEDLPLLRCLTNNALLWQYPGTTLDYSAPFPLSFVMAGSEAGGMAGATSVHQAQTAPQAFLPAANPQVDPAPLDPKLAQATLDVLENASSAEVGQAKLSVGAFPEAIALFRAALAKDANDPIALRGLAEALSESGGDLKEARTLATRLAGVAPGSLVGPEAMIHVCSAEKDDLCVFESWKKLLASTEVQQAKANKDAGLPRKSVVDEMQELAKQSAARLRARAASGAPAAAQPAAPPADPCAGEQGDERQALCVVKRCFDEGGVAYAKSLSAQGVEYAAGDWRLKSVGAGKLLVTRPIAAKVAAGAPAAPGHDAIWLVKVGENFSIQPSTADARQITLTHNACGAPK